MKTNIHLVRHGEVYNPKQVFYGRIPGYFLSEKGKEEVHALGKHLQQKPIKKVYASPLDRAKQTASILSEYFSGVGTHYDTRLIEVASPLEGRGFDEVDGFNFYDEQYTSQGGETIEDIQKRMMLFFQDMIASHPEEEILVVSHGDPIMIMRSFYLKKNVTITDLRGGYYIHTAHGVEVLVDGEDIRVTDIIPF
jgi:broad specificity phosphatase PhoE